MLTGAALGLGPGAAIGLGRFAYALLLPAMQASLQLGLAQAGALGSANTGGYLLGALVSHRVLGAVGYRRGFYASLALQALTLLLMGAEVGLPAMFALRAAQGALGAQVFVGGAALLLASGGRAAALGTYFGGVGAGVALSVLVVPLVERWQAGWLALAGLAVALTLLALLALPRLREPGPPARGRERSLGPIAAALLAYGLYGAGYIGYMTFVTGGLGAALAPFWLVLGLASMATGAVWGPLVGRFGGAGGLRLSLLLLLAASLEPLLAAAPFLSAALFGLAFLGVITAVTDLFRRHLPPGAWPRAMAHSTVAFGAGQAVGPGLTGLVGDLSGGVSGALWAASVLLAAALVVALLPDRAARPGGAAAAGPGAATTARASYGDARGGPRPGRP